MIPPATIKIIIVIQMLLLLFPIGSSLLSHYYGISQEIMSENQNELEFFFLLQMNGKISLPELFMKIWT